MYTEIFYVNKHINNIIELTNHIYVHNGIDRGLQPKFKKFFGLNCIYFFSVIFVSSFILRP